MTTSLTPQELHTVEVIDRQLDAYNQRNIEAFAVTYHEDVEIYRFPGGLDYCGKNELIQRYGSKFARLKFLKATSLQRMVQGNILVDHELAESSSVNAEQIDESVKVIVAYEVEEGLIRRVTFMQG